MSLTPENNRLIRTLSCWNAGGGHLGVKSDDSWRAAQRPAHVARRAPVCGLS